MTAEEVKAFRLAQGWTQTQLAHAMDVTKTTVYMWECVGAPLKREASFAMIAFYRAGLDGPLFPTEWGEKAARAIIGEYSHRIVEADTMRKPRGRPRLDKPIRHELIKAAGS